MKGTIALQSQSPFPTFIQGQAPITVGLVSSANSALLPQTLAILAAAPDPVDPISAFWINSAMIRLQARGATYQQSAAVVANLQRFIAGGVVRWSEFGVNPANLDNTSALNALPTGMLVIGDTPGVINFAKQWIWKSQTWLLLDQSMQMAYTAIIPGPGTGQIEAAMAPNFANDITVIGLNLTVPLPAQCLLAGNLTNFNLIDASMQPNVRMTTYGILQSLPTAPSPPYTADHTAIVSIPASVPDLSFVYDPTLTTGRYIRRFNPDFTLNQDPLNKQNVWNTPLNIGNRLWQLRTFSSISSRGWVIGDTLGIKSKHGAIDYLRIINGSNILLDSISFQRGSRCVLSNINGLTLTNWNILRPSSDVLTTNDGGAQMTTCTGILVDGYTAQNTGDDMVAFFESCTGYITGANLSDSFARGILLVDSVDMVVDPANVVTRCPVLTILKLNAITKAYIAKMTVQPDGERQVIIDKLVTSLLAGAVSGTNILALMDSMFLLKSHDEQAARVNLINPAQVATVAGLPVFSIDTGYAGDGIAGTIRTGVTPALYTQNSASMYVFIVNPVSENKACCGGLTGSNGAYIIPNNAGSITTQTNAATADTDLVPPTVPPTPVTNQSVGFSLWSRTAANAVAVYDSNEITETIGGPIATHTTASSGIPAAMFMLSNGASFSTTQQAVFGFGAALTPDQVTDLYNAIEVFVGSF